MVRGLAAFGVIVCLQAITWSCGSRNTSTGVPRSTPPDQPPDPQSGVAVTPERTAPTPPAALPRAEGASDDCALVALPGEPVATVALGERVEPFNAPRPSNESERLLFRQLYETLVGADCMGRVVPGLASSWRLDADGRTWLMTLRENARFSDGTPVVAGDVRAGWTRNSTGDELPPYVSRLVESIVPLSDRTLAIRLRNRRTDVPLALAHPDLAVAKFVPDSRWPVGTRSWRIAPDDGVAAPTGTSLITVLRDDLPPIRFLVAPGDPRDLLDREVDLLLTRDSAALDYAATLPQFQSLALAWQRTHVLLTPGRSRSAPSLAEDARQLLADDAVRGEARGALGPFWWRAPLDCDITFAPPQGQFSPTPRIVYEANDGVGRDLAERLVGLVRTSGPGASAFLDVFLPDRPQRTYQRATGLTGEALARARRLGTDAGYVMSVDSRPLDPCRDLQTLMDGARWLDPETIVPLVDTRLHAILRRGRSGVTAEWDGGLLITQVHGPG